MSQHSTAEIRTLAVAVVNGHPEGIHYSKLVKAIQAKHPKLGKGVVQGAIFDLDKKHPNEIAKPSRGLFVPVGKDGVEHDHQAPPVAAKFAESEFYALFAEWLKNEDEATEAISLGNSVMGQRWGTPDVVATYKAQAGDLYKFETEIITAEVKIEPTAPVVAFGQAVAYRLFSMKTYIAMPTNMAEADRDRLEALCILFGVGLVFFDLNKDSPNFQHNVRAQRHLPDVFYVNKFLEALRKHDSAKYNRLF